MKRSTDEYNPAKTWKNDHMKDIKRINIEDLEIYSTHKEW